jgi:hypothetical protein
VLNDLLHLVAGVVNFSGEVLCIVAGERSGGLVGNVISFLKRIQFKIISDALSQEINICINRTTVDVIRRELKEVKPRVDKVVEDGVEEVLVTGITVGTDVAWIVVITKVHGSDVLLKEKEEVEKVRFKKTHHLTLCGWLCFNNTIKRCKIVIIVIAHFIVSFQKLISA